MNDTTSDFRRPLHWSLLLTVIAMAFALLLAGLQGLRPHTYWWHVAIGEFTAVWQAVPDEQIFNYTVPPEQLWVHTEWLGSVVLAALHELAGAELSLLVRNVLLALTVGLVAWALARRHRSLSAIAVPCALATGLFVFFAGVEPATLALPVAAFALICVFRLLEQPQQFWWALPLPGAILAVINLHFATAVSLIAVGLVVAVHLMRNSRHNDQRRRIIVAALISASSLFCLLGFVYGPSYWSTAFFFAFDSPFSIVSVAVLATLTIAVASLLHHHHRLAVGTILAATATPALFAPSTLPLFAVAAALAMAPFFDGLDDAKKEFRPGKRTIAVALLLVASAIALQPGTTTRDPVVTALDSDLRTEPPLKGVMSADRPLRCAEELRRTGRLARVFHAPDDAGFLLYHLLAPENPHLPLFDDPRSLTSFDDRQRARNLLLHAEDFALFDDFEIDAVVIDRHIYPVLANALEDDEHWYDLRPQDDHRYTCFLDTSPSVTE